MKIVMVANDTTFIYNLRREILQAFIKKGVEVTLVAEILGFQEELEQMGCTIIGTHTARHGKNPLKDLRLYRFYYKVLQETHPDIVFTNNIKPNVYAGSACAKLEIPYIVNVCGLGTPVENPGPLQVLTCTLYKRGVKKAKCVFFQNEANRQFFVERKMLNGPCRLLPGSGVNLDHFKLLEYPHNKTIDFLYISRVMKEKGADQYLEAAKAVHAKHPETVFHILGSCDDESYLGRLREAEQQGYIQYHGQQKEVLPFQKNSACTVHPSYYPEGMSNVLLEGAACGRPIITTDRSGCREIIKDGVNGYICRQRDSADLIKQIERFLNLSWEQRRDMGLAGRRKVEKEFDRQIVVKAYLDEIQTMTGR